MRRFERGRLGPPRPDVLAAEAPLDIEVEGELLATTLRTPGQDEALVRGFLLTDGWVDRGGDVASVRFAPGGGRALVRLAAGVPRPPGRAGVRRGTLTVSACGLCGRPGIDDLVASLRPPPRGARLAAELVLRAPELLSEGQAGFRRTGGLHAAGALRSSGELLAVAEDVGRHNAVDKVVGALLATDPELAAPPEALVVSGRASFEIVLKAARARIGAVLAVSAPSSAAVALAERLGMLLCGFVRPGRFNLYCGEERLRP